MGLDFYYQGQIKRTLDLVCVPQKSELSAQTAHLAQDFLLRPKLTSLSPTYSLNKNILS